MRFYRMMKSLKRAADAVCTGVLCAVFLLWGCAMHLLYLPRVIYTSPEAKRQIGRGGAILIANHQSHKDGFFVPQVLFRLSPYVLVTRKWYDKKGLHFIFRHLRYIPINLNEPDAEWMTLTERALKKGKSVLIFPEGKLERNGVPEPFHSGFLLPAKHLNVPVIPMAIVGEYRIFRRQKLIIGEAIPLELHAPGRTSAVLGAAAARCESAVRGLYNAYALPGKGESGNGTGEPRDGERSPDLHAPADSARK